MLVVLFPPRGDTPEYRLRSLREREIITERIRAAARARRKRRLLRWGLGPLRALRRRYRTHRDQAAMSARQRAEERRGQRSLT